MGEKAYVIMGEKAYVILGEKTYVFICTGCSQIQCHKFQAMML